MKPTAQDKGFSFKEVIGIFWEWRQASISVEVCFFGKAESSDTVRVSIDGLVTLVDPEEIQTANVFAHIGFARGKLIHMESV